jgi:hypothetical protein
MDMPARHIHTLRADIKRRTMDFSESWGGRLAAVPPVADPLSSFGRKAPHRSR